MDDHDALSKNMADLHILWSSAWNSLTSFFYLLLLSATCLWKSFFDAPAVTLLRGHQFKVRQPRFQLARRQAAFAVRVVGPLNRLPPSVADAKCVQGAARQLLGDYFPGSCLTPCKFIYICTWCWHASAIF